MNTCIFWFTLLNRLNANEIVAREFSVILEEMNMEFTPQQFGHLLHWFNALGLAAIREDLKNNKSDKDKTKTIEPIIVKDSVPTMLLNVIVNKMNVALRESQKQPGIEVECTFEFLLQYSTMSKMAIGF